MSDPTTTTTTTTTTITPPSLLSLAQTHVSHPIPPSLLHPILSSPPFIPLPDTFNTRDLGLLPGSPIRPGLLYRSGGFPRGTISPAGRAALTDTLKVAKIFDIRSVREHVTLPDPEVGGGVEVVWVAPGEEDAVVGLGEFVEGEGEEGFVKMYLDVLGGYKGAVRAVLEWVGGWREGEGGGLFHCTAGRDRTGVVAGLLLSLAGASADTIALDYILSRIGTEPAREHLLAFALKGSGAESVETPGFLNLVSLRISCWDAFVKAVETEYGGFEGYVTKTLGFSDEDVAKIKANLVLKN